VQAVNGLPATAVVVTLGPWPAPAGFAANIAGRSATLAWQPIPWATGYLVFRQLDGERAFQQITATPLSVDDETLAWRRRSPHIHLVIYA
jgi:hypothetical protein